MEFMNVVRSLQSKPPIYNNSAKNTSIHIIHFTKVSQKSKTGDESFKLVPKLLCENDNSHLNSDAFGEDEEIKRSNEKIKSNGVPLK
jgi:hypothetical protein